MNTAGYSLPYPNSSNNASLFPPLVDNSSLSSASPPLNDQQPHEEGEGGLLWNNVNTFAIPDDTIPNPPPVQNSGFAKELLSKVNSNSSTSLYQDNSVDAKKDDGTVFHISWGGDDKPPVELHPQDEPIKLTRPLPKPRGIRKLPEPEPSEDGTIDEDTLKRRKNTDAARRSRLKKLMKVDQLENQVNALQAENAKLVLNNAVLESQKRSLYAKELEYKKRIKYLEDIMICQGWDFENNYHVNSDQW